MDKYWLKAEFLVLLNANQPGHAFNFSNGWIYNFCRRYHISSKASTEKKYLSVQERLPLCYGFHQEIWSIQVAFPQVDDIWGAFPPENIWNADHIPAPFASNANRSLSLKVRSTIAHTHRIFQHGLPSVPTCARKNNDSLCVCGLYLG